MAYTIINEQKIQRILKETKSSPADKISAILEKAGRQNGLSLEDAGCLVNLSDKKMLRSLFSVAGRVKRSIYGERLVFFAPLYVSDFCVNDCVYCNFHSSNKSLKRRRLSLEEMKSQVRHLIAMGHKRVLVEFGEDPRHSGINYIVKVIKAIYRVKSRAGNIRRINVNIAATSEEDYRKLKACHIGTYQLFQETYHKGTYKSVHQNGPKSDYNRQITAYDRALKAGIDDIGLGVLFGLYDWRFEVLALLMHAQYLDKKYHVGPHTISVPRIQPAPSVGYIPGYKVSDDDFLKLIAILRLAVPYTGMIISTRESKEIRKAAFKIGISQASAASCTTIGGYGRKTKQPQFVIQDERPLKEVIESIMEDGFLPSFCTACYRLGRTGEAFMDISKHGQIHKFCRSNGLLTFAEYLEDFSSGSLYAKGWKLIYAYLTKIKGQELRKKTEDCLLEIKQGKRDLYI